MLQLLAAVLALLAVGSAIAIAVRNDRRRRAAERLERARQHERAACADSLLRGEDDEEVRHAWPYIVAMVERGDLASADDIDRVVGKLASSGFASVAEEASFEIAPDGASPDRVEIYNLAYRTPSATCSAAELIAALQRLSAALRASEGTRDGLRST